MPVHYRQGLGTEDAQAGEEARKEEGLAPMPLEERFGVSQPLGVMKR